MLVHLEFSNTSLVEYQIFGITHAIFHCLISNIYSIFACFRNFGHPFGKCFILFPFRSCIAGCAMQKRIFTILISWLKLGKTIRFCFFPSCFSAFNFQIKRTTFLSIIVNYYFLLLGISFTRSVNNRTCILKHRNDVGQNKRLSKLIFSRRKQSGPLPSPFFFVINEIFAVALPKCHVLTIKTFTDVVRT
ncbi:hypothetical protein SDC9_86522 [bioreactor metagenome]|uniref:Uncharacterized protein n=1 Tax=bioreactor metagenome TaxID=1076179 RepID=A0A644ZGC3_9ZZZZ